MDEAIERYPDHLLPIAGQSGSWGGSGLAEPGDQLGLFLDAREAFLLDYGYNTARAYWGDLDDLLIWCVEHGVEVLEISDHQVDAYYDDLRRLGYSTNTIRRRRACFRGFFKSLADTSSQS